MFKFQIAKNIDCKQPQNFFCGKNIKIVFIIIFILLIITAIVLPIANVIFWAKAGKDIQITIKQGEGTREIAKNLKNEKLIGSAWVFSTLVYARHWYLQPGVYQIKPEMSMFDIIKMLHEGKVEEHLVTIPEGWRATQIDEVLAQKGIIKKGEFLKIASANEGYLFPDTYRFALDIEPSKIRDIMLENFRKRTEGIEISQKTLIIASIVEREAKFDEDRPKIAGVYYNRLEKGMRLEADPTIQYGKGNWGPITVSDYKNFQSPYNTYLRNGLPPGPICNPGLKSIEAVLYPQKDGFLYFFHDSDGHAVYSAVLKEHEAKLKGE